VIYAIEAVGLNAVKVGYARDAEAVHYRLMTLQIGCPAELRLVATREGDKRLEAALHREWASHAIRGEWFAIEVLALFGAAEGSDRILMRCIDCGALRKLKHRRPHATGRCKSCRGKHEAKALCVVCGCGGARPYGYNYPGDEGLKLCPTCKRVEKEARASVRRAKQSAAMRGNTNAVGRSARGRVLAVAA
jgi:hypothetical protein